MGLEALILNKPLISISFKDLDRTNTYKKAKFVDVVYNGEQLEKAIKNKKVGVDRDFMKKQLYKLDGKSSQRAVDFIIGSQYTEL